MLLALPTATVVRRVADWAASTRPDADEHLARLHLALAVARKPEYSMLLATAALVSGTHTEYTAHGKISGELGHLI